MGHGGEKEVVMKIIALATIMASLLLVTHEVSIENEESDMIDLRKPLKKITKRYISTDTGNQKRSNEFYEFVEEKLIQHSQALEHLVKLTNEILSAVGALAENLGKLSEEPKLPEKMDIHHEREERSSDTVESRRFLTKPSEDGFSTNDGSSEWCSVAFLCHRTMTSVCGFDDSFGYGKFDDLCHMLQVNCYWNYNFALVPNCRPTFYTQSISP